MHRVKGVDFLIGYAVACSSYQARVQEFLSGKLQVCKVLGGGGVHYFPGGPLANFYDLNVVFQGDEGPDPLPSFGSPHASTLKLSSHTSV